MRFWHRNLEPRDAHATWRCLASGSAESCRAGFNRSGERFGRSCDALADRRSPFSHIRTAQVSKRSKCADLHPQSQRRESYPGVRTLVEFNRAGSLRSQMGSVANGNASDHARPVWAEFATNAAALRASIGESWHVFPANWGEGRKVAIKRSDRVNFDSQPCGQYAFHDLMKFLSAAPVGHSSRPNVSFAQCH